MGKETKIGLSIIGCLVLILTGVLAYRFVGKGSGPEKIANSENPEAAANADIAKKGPADSSKAAALAKKNGAKPFVSKPPTVVPETNRSRSNLGQNLWASLADNKKNDATVPSPHSNPNRSAPGNGANLKTDGSQRSVTVTASPLAPWKSSPSTLDVKASDPFLARSSRGDYPSGTESKTNLPAPPNFQRGGTQLSPYQPYGSASPRVNSVATEKRPGGNTVLPGMKTTPDNAHPSSNRAATYPGGSLRQPAGSPNHLSGAPQGTRQSTGIYNTYRPSQSTGGSSYTNSPSNYSAPPQSASSNSYRASASPDQGSSWRNTGVNGNPLSGQIGSSGNSAMAGSRSSFDPSARRGDGTYVVQPGDSFWTISERLYGTGAYFRALAEHNQARCLDPSRLKVGETLSAPGIAELERDYSALCPSSKRRDMARRRATTMEASPRYAGGGGGQIYTVQAGDTLFDIAQYELGEGRRWLEIYDLNRNLLREDYDYLVPGMKLQLPATGAKGMTQIPTQQHSYR